METVGDVRKALEAFPDDMPIIKSKDEEGNGFTTIWCIQREAFLRHDSEYPLHPSDIAAGEYGEDPELVTKVVIWG